ncbi:MAG: porin family protein [Odoribacter sp.]|nr:porin family protein [Odoribacter sp.]
MKKLLLALVAVFGITTASQAQVSLQASYGGYTQMDAMDMHDGGSVNTAWGDVTVGAWFDVAPKFKLGATYTFSSTDFKHSDANAYYHVIMLNGRYDYWRNSIVKLYGHLGIGCDITHITAGDYRENKGYFAFQVSPLGAEVDLNRTVGIFGELGFGAQGLLQVGFRFKL